MNRSARRRGTVVCSVAVVAALTLSACGSTKKNGGSGGSGGTGDTSAPGVTSTSITIGTT